MPKKIRVRFAPSPTGPLHIGGVRTALYNYLFAKKYKGDFILRIEDTDQNRYIEGAENYIIEALEWCGIPFDEGPGKEKEVGPYRQSERKDIYRKYTDILIAKGKAYYAFDSNEDLDQHRREQEAQGQTFSYNGSNREKMSNSLSLPNEEVLRRLAEGEAYVIRFKTPPNERLQLEDIVRGTMVIDTNSLDDKVLFKSDGLPTYHLANIVDDHLMDITHVIRGEEWLPSLALHQQLYEAFDWIPPQFAHLPLIMKPTGKGKLSKRDGEKMGFPVFPLSWGAAKGYREEGFFPEAVINFLALLGWNPGTDQELYRMDELIETFSLERVHKGGARFDPEKTKWYNHHYLQGKGNRELALLFQRQLLEKDIVLPSQNPIDFLEKVVSLIKERATFVSDFWSLGHFFFISPATYNENAVKKIWKDTTPNIMSQLVVILNNVEAFSSDTIEFHVKRWLEEQGLSFGNVMAPLRLILVGDMKGPHLFDIMALIGKTETLTRIQKALSTI